MDAATIVLTQRMGVVEAAIDQASNLVDRVVALESKLAEAEKKIHSLESKLSRVRRKKVEE